MTTHVRFYICLISVNVLLSLDETYADVMPVRLNEGAVSAYVYVILSYMSIMTHKCIFWLVLKFIYSLKLPLKQNLL